MRRSRRGRRSGIRALVVLALAAGLLVAMAGVAEAARIRNVAQLRQSCGKSSSGQFSVSSDGQSAICDLAGGKTIICNNRAKGRKCQVVKTIKFELEPDDSVKVPGGSLTTPDVPKSQEFRRSVDFEFMGDVCTGLAGEYLLTTDGAYGACGVPRGTIICAEALTENNCTGFANTKSNAVRLSEQFDVAVRVLYLTAERGDGSSGQTTSPTSPPTTSSTTTSSTTTTTLSD